MSAIPAYLTRARTAVQIEGTAHADRPCNATGSPTDAALPHATAYEIRNKSAAPPGSIPLLADVLALAHARGFPQVTFDTQTISDADGWLTLVRSADAEYLRVLRTALLAAQRQDGPGSTPVLPLLRPSPR